MNYYFDSPIFLHYLNRELRETERKNFFDDEVFDFIRVSSIISKNYIYTGSALIWECYDLYPKSVQLLCNLEKNALACFVSNHLNIDSFLEKRRRLYFHDKERYPIYFNDDIKKFPWPSNPKEISGDTTSALASSVFNLINGNDYENSNFMLTSKEKTEILKRLSLKIEYGSAVTYSLFKDIYFSTEKKLHFKRIMVSYFNKRFLDAFQGAILTNIPGIGYYDKYQKTEFLFDFVILKEMLLRLLIISGFSNAEKEFYNIIAIKGDKYYNVFLQEIRKLLHGLYTLCNGDKSNALIYIKGINYLKDNNSFKLEDKLDNLFSFNNNLLKHDEFRKGYESMKITSKKVLILTATILEYKVAREIASARGLKFVEKELDNENFSYTECIGYNDLNVFLARTHMGSLNSALSVFKLCESLKIDYVIMGGICAGLKKDTQQIGDILVSEKIHNYDFAKKTAEERISRGDTIPSNRYLLDKFVLESYEWEKGKVDFGLIISSSVLSNSQVFVEEVKKENPDAIGYEMEGGGLIFSSQILHEKWMLVKSICDWGYNKKNSYQEMAALNSYNFIFNTLMKKIGN